MNVRRVVMRCSIARGNDEDVTVADLQAVGGGDGGGDVSFGVLDGGNEIGAFGEAGGNRRRKRAAGAVRVLGGDALGREADHVALPRPEIDTVFALTVAAFDQHIARAKL